MSIQGQADVLTTEQRTVAYYQTLGSFLGIDPNNSRLEAFRVDEESKLMLEVSARIECLDENEVYELLGTTQEELINIILKNNYPIVTEVQRANNLVYTKVGIGDLENWQYNTVGFGLTGIYVYGQYRNKTIIPSPLIEYYKTPLNEIFNTVIDSLLRHLEISSDNKICLLEKLELIEKNLDAKRPTNNNNTLIIGPACSGKSTLFRKIIGTGLATNFNPNEERIDRQFTSIYDEVIRQSNGDLKASFTVLDFAKEILKALIDPLAHISDIDPNNCRPIDIYNLGASPPKNGATPYYSLNTVLSLNLERDLRVQSLYSQLNSNGYVVGDIGRSFKTIAQILSYTNINISDLDTDEKETLYRIATILLEINWYPKNLIFIHLDPEIRKDLFKMQIPSEQNRRLHSFTTGDNHLEFYKWFLQELENRRSDLSITTLNSFEEFNKINNLGVESRVGDRNAYIETQKFSFLDPILMIHPKAVQNKDLDRYKDSLSKACDIYVRQITDSMKNLREGIFQLPNIENLAILIQDNNFTQLNSLMGQILNELGSIPEFIFANQGILIEGGNIYSIQNLYNSKAVLLYLQDLINDLEEEI